MAIVVLGKLFGGALYGLIPLGMCVSSGVFLWMKEVIRSGREFEWESEKIRGKTVSAETSPFYIVLMFQGHCKSNTRVRRVDELFPRCDVGAYRPRYLRFSCRHLGRCHASFGSRSHRKCSSC